MNKQLLVFAAILAIFTSSCSSLRIEKRHYKNGFYVHKSGVKTHNGAPTAAMTEEIENATEAKQGQNLPASDDSNITPVPQPGIMSIPAQVVGNQTPTTPHAISTEPTVSDEITNAEEKPAVAKAEDAEPTAADDTETILLVILAILLPPLAVYMKEGVTTRFWIDLICWLLGGGFFFTPFFYGGGLWLFAVIFALLIVLDVI